MIVLALPLTAILALGSAGPAPADSLQAAKELYASAAYDDALAMLTRMSSGAPAEQAVEIEEYESLCLYALGRTADAESAVRDLIQRNPLFSLQGDDVSPRVQAMFAQVRKGLLPQIAKEKYAAAKAEMDAQQYAAAEPHLAEVRKIIDEAARMGVKDTSLDDLGTLADGFRELAGAAIAKAAAAAAAARPAVTSAPVVAPKRPPTPEIFDANDAGVVPPVALVQEIPPVPRELVFGLENRKGLLAVTIASDGHVESATMREPFRSPYDQLVLSAAKSWRYKPATKDGKPVRYAITITLAYKPGD